MVYAADKYLRTFLGLNGIRNPALLANTEYEDPTYPMFHVQFKFGPALPDAKHPDYVANRLLDSGSNPESAISYLKSISEPERAESLSKFIDALKTISEKTPYYFQGISGIDNLMKMHYPVDSKTPFAEQQDILLSVKTLESIDFRILALKDLYNKSVFDRKYRRWVLPVNLRRFRMRIMIGEYRQMAITEENFSVNPRQLMDTLRDVDIFNASNVGGKLLGRVSEGSLSFIKRLQWWDNHFSCLVFDCHDCEFEMNSAPEAFSNLSHGDSLRNPLTNSFGIRVGRVVNTNVYSLLKFVLTDDILYQSFLRAQAQSTTKNSTADDKKYGNIMKKLTKEDTEEKAAILSKQYQQIFKPVYDSWGSYQNLLREKGDNKRVILENRDFESAVSADLNEGLGALGIGDALGNGTNFGPGLGSVGNFVGDTLSGLAQEALGMATEQVTKNVFDNALYNSIAGTALGVLNGDLNAAARNFTNPALAAQLGINLEFSNNPVPPNLRDGVPSKLDLTPPNVQRSLTDVRANLTGEGADPRFQAIGRPGQSLFSNPESIEKAMQPQTIEFTEVRKETKMSTTNVEFTEVKKETRLNPQKETLVGATPKKTFDSTNADLQGAQALKDLTPSNADLTGAQPIRDLNPTNADLQGAQALKDLTPSNADLTGAQPIRDLNPTNADLEGAQPIRDLNPTNADLEGAQPLKDLTPSNADLQGARPLKDLTPSNADLTGAEPIKDLTPSNADLTGAEPIKDLKPSNADLQGAQPLKDLTPSNADLEGAQPIRDLNPINADLIGSQPLKDLTPSNADLQGAQPIRDLTPSNADLQGAQAIKDLTPSNADLQGAEAIKDLTPSNVGLQGIQPMRDLNTTNADLTGAEAIRDLTPSNADLQGTQPIRDLTPSNADLQGASAQRAFTETNADLNGASPSMRFDNDNVKLEGKLSSDKFNSSNVGFTGSSTKTVNNLGVENLEGKDALREFTETNVGDMQSNTKEYSSLGTEALVGSEPIRNMNMSNADLDINSSNSKLQTNVELSGYEPTQPILGVENLTGAKPLTNLVMRNSELVGADNNSGATRIVNVDLEGAQKQTSMMNKDELKGAGKLTSMNQKNVNLKQAAPSNTMVPKNTELIGFNPSVTMTQNVDFITMSSSETLEIQTVELEGKPKTVDVSMTNVGLSGSSKEETFQIKNILGIQPPKTD